MLEGHLTPEMTATFTGSYTNTDPVVRPGGMTSQLQALDSVVNKAVKDHLKQFYCEWLLEGDHVLTSARRITSPV
jgi:hypothetical protein